MYYMTFSVWKVDQKNLESFEMCWRRIEKTSWTDRVRNLNITNSPGGQEYPTDSKMKEG
jgi:hypothetical protein